MFKIKEVYNCELKAIEGEQKIELDLNTRYRNDKVSVDIGIKNETIDLIMEFKIKDNKYRVNITNIPSEYVENCPNMTGEYCYNIIEKLYNEGHEFIKDEDIDFQKYLVKE